MIKNGKQIIKQSRTSNGITVITEELPFLRSVAFSVWVKAGSRHETEKENGISHFIEHLIFKGTETLRSRDISLAVDQMGGAINAFTTRQEISFYIKVLDTEIENGIKLLTDIVANPAFREEDIALEKNVILEEIRMYEDSPDDAVADRFFEKFWLDQSIGRPVQGKIHSVAELHRPQISDYYARALRTDRLVVAAAGRLDHDEVVKLVEEKFSHLKKSDGPVNPPQPEPNVFHETIVRPRLEQFRFIFGTPGVSANDESRYRLMLLSTLIGGNSSSRLFQKAREERGLVYDISCGSYSYEDTGLFAISAGTHPDTVDELFEIIHTELTTIVNTPPSDDEMNTLKNYVKGNLVLSMENSGSRMNRLAKYMLHQDRYYTMDELLEIIDGITKDDLLESAREIIPGKWSLAVIQPELDIKINLEHLEIGI